MSLSARAILPGPLALVLAASHAAAQPQPQPQPQTQPQAQTPTPEQIEEARRHFDRGLALFDHNDYSGALAEFQRSYDLSGRPSLLFNIAAAWQAMHRYPEAITAMQRYLAESPDLRPTERREAERTLHELEGMIAHVRVATEPANAAVTLDGRPLSTGANVSVGPGVHVLEATFEGRRAREEFTIASGEERELRLVIQGATTVVPPTGPATLAVSGIAPEATVTIDRTPRPHTAPIELTPGDHEVSVAQRGHAPWNGHITARARAAHRLEVSLAPIRPAGMRPIWFWSSVGLTGAFALGSIITGIAAISTHDEFSTWTVRTAESEALASRGRALAITADVLGVAALATAGVSVWLFTRTNLRGSTSTAEFAFVPSPDGAAFSTRVHF